MKTCLVCCSRVVLILLLTVSAAWAQATAQMSGTVRDESGAVLPGVTVTVTQTDTGQNGPLPLNSNPMHQVKYDLVH